MYKRYSTLQVFITFSAYILRAFPLHINFLRPHLSAVTISNLQNKRFENILTLAPNYKQQQDPKHTPINLSLIVSCFFQLAEQIALRIHLEHPQNKQFSLFPTLKKWKFSSSRQFLFFNTKFKSISI